MKKLHQYALVHAVGAVLYIAACVSVLAIFDQTQLVLPGLLGPMIILLLLVISVAVMGMLIFARPVLWYLDGKKKDAVVLAIWTVGYMIAAFVVLLAIALLLAHPAPVMPQ